MPRCIIRLHGTGNYEQSTKRLCYDSQKICWKLPSSTDPSDNNFVSSDVNNCIN